MNTDTAILTALARWREDEERYPGQMVLLELQLDRPCSLCGGSQFCPAGCPMATCTVDYQTKPWRRIVPIRRIECRRDQEGEWSKHLVHGRDCDACNIYGFCMSCTTDGRERRRAWKEGTSFLVDSVPLYSVPGHQLTDPIRVTVGQVRKELRERESPRQLDLLGAVA